MCLIVQWAMSLACLWSHHTPNVFEGDDVYTSSLARAFPLMFSGSLPSLCLIASLLGPTTELFSDQGITVYNQYNAKRTPKNTYKLDSMKLFNNRASEFVTLHTLHNGVLKLTRKDLNVADDGVVTAVAVKEKVCQHTSLRPSDLQLIHGGKALSDDAALALQSRPGKEPAGRYYLILKTSAATMCHLTAKVSAHGKHYTVSVTVPANMKVSSFKKELVKSMPKEATIPASAQRLVCRGQLLHDYNYVGDFLLTDSNRYTRNAVKTKDVDSALPSDVTLFVSAAVDLSKEVHVRFKMPNGQTFKEYLSISTPLIYLREILWRQHRIPKDIPMYFYLADEVTGQERLLDMAKTLYDYDVSSDVTLRMLPYVIVEVDVPCRPPSPVSVTVARSPTSKRRSTAKCGPTKSPKTIGGSSASTASAKATGLFGLKKGFFGTNSSSGKKK